MHHLRWVGLGGLLLVCLGSVADFALRADEQAAEARPDPNELKAPPNWPKDHPLPQVASNCARCHLTAGRELTQAVVFYVHSVHDLNHLTCYDCHGGNSEDDVHAHEDEYGFIGTKLSAHIKQCSECHAEEAEVLASGPHHWDFSVRINTKYPTCIDCHGNHDIGNPPADFLLADVCADCHRNFEKKFPNVASMVDGYDQLWHTIGKLRDEKLGASEERVPEGMDDELAELRHQAMQVMHASHEVDAETASQWVESADKLRQKLENWLNEAD